MKKHAILWIAGIAIVGVAAYLIFRPSTTAVPTIQTTNKTNGQVTIGYNGTSTLYTLTSGAAPTAVATTGYTISYSGSVFTLKDSAGNVVATA